MLVVRMVVCFAAKLGFYMRSADIKGEFIQSGARNRDVYVLPPREFHRKRGVFWNILKLPKGMSDTRRKWLLRVDKWFWRKAGMVIAKGIYQVFIRIGKGNIIQIFAKVIEDFLVTG